MNFVYIKVITVIEFLGAASILSQTSSSDVKRVQFFGDISRVFLQRQKWIVNYYVKKFVKESQ